MITESFLIFTIICIVAHILRTIYEILKHRKKIKASRLTFIVVFINMALLWASWFGLCEQDVVKVDVPAFIRYFGLFLFVSGIVLFLTALLTIKALESYNGDLITHGIYAKIRHPMYLSFILWLIGVPVFYGGLLSFILGLLFSINVMFWRHLEETELMDRFPGYKDYRKRTIF